MGGRNDSPKKAQEVGAGVPFGCLAGYFAGFYILRGIEGKRAVTVVLETVAFGASRRERQDWIESIQRLNGCFFIDAEHSSMLRREDRVRWCRLPCSNSGSLLAI